MATIPNARERFERIVREHRFKRKGPNEAARDCPFCGGDDRCVLTLKGPDELYIHDRGGCGWKDLNSYFGLLDDKARRTTPSSACYAVPKQEPYREPVSETRPKAIEFWNNADDDDATVAAHPYAKRKRITHAFGARRGIAGGKRVGYNADCILVPNRNWDGEFIGVEVINANKDKQTYGNKGLLMLGNLEDAPHIHLCEGWATAWALAQMFPKRFAAVVCFGKQIQRAIPEVSTRYTGRPVIHAESAQNRDAWDIWHSGRGDAYVQKVMGVLA